MPTFSFPAASFVIEGDPEAVRETGRAYGRFATTAGEAATGLRTLDSGSWVGSEGDLFRARVGEIPPPLDVANGAFAQVARALDGFADVLASAQGRMAGVRADAEHAFSALARAGDDDGGLQDAWDDQLTAAAGLRGQVVEAARQAAASIRADGRASPAAGQSWLADHWEDGQRWLSARLDDLKDFVAGLFSDGVGWLGEIPAGTLIGAGLVLWGAGDTLDTSVDWAEGRIGGRELAFPCRLRAGHRLRRRPRGEVRRQGPGQARPRAGRQAAALDRRPHHAGALAGGADRVVRHLVLADAPLGVLTLPLSEELAAALMGWAEEFDATLNQEHPADSGFPLERDRDAFLRRGRDLAGRLARELGPGYRVTYQGDGTIPEQLVGGTDAAEPGLSS